MNTLPAILTTGAIAGNLHEFIMQSALTSDELAWRNYFLRAL